MAFDCLPVVDRCDVFGPLARTCCELSFMACGWVVVAGLGAVCVTGLKVTDGLAIGAAAGVS